VIFITGHGTVLPSGDCRDDGRAFDFDRRSDCGRHLLETIERALHWMIGRTKSVSERATLQVSVGLTDTPER